MISSVVVIFLSRESCKNNKDLTPFKALKSVIMLRKAIKTLVLSVFVYDTLKMTIVMLE